MTRPVVTVLPVLPPRGAVFVFVSFLMTALLVSGGCMPAKIMMSKGEFLPGCTRDLRVIYEPGTSEPEQIFVNRMEAEFGPDPREDHKTDVTPINRWVAASQSYDFRGAHDIICSNDKIKLVFGREGAWSVEFMTIEKDPRNSPVRAEYEEAPEDKPGRWIFHVKSVPGFSESPPPPAPTAEQQTLDVLVQKSCNLRERPTQASAAILTLPAGSQVLVKGRQGSWSLVGYSGRTGWMSDLCLTR